MIIRRLCCGLRNVKIHAEDLKLEGESVKLLHVKCSPKPCVTPTSRHAVVDPKKRCILLAEEIFDDELVQASWTEFRAALSKKSINRPRLDFIL